MGARAVLTELIDVLRQQTGAVVAGDHQAVLSGVSRHELLLAELESTEIDASPEELRKLHGQITRERNKLRSLLLSELGRVDFLLRVTLGARAEGAAGYSKPGSRRPAGGSRLNRRV